MADHDFPKLRALANDLRGYHIRFGILAEVEQGAITEEHLRDLADGVVALLDEVENNTCARHAGQAHGKEAEELRSGIEKILNANVIDGSARGRLQLLLERVDARDSLAHLERLDAVTAERDALIVRRDELLALVAKISQTTPLESEVSEALAQRGALLAEVGTLKAKLREVSLSGPIGETDVGIALQHVLEERDAGHTALTGANVPRIDSDGTTRKLTLPERITLLVEQRDYARLASIAQAKDAAEMQRQRDEALRERDELREESQLWMDNEVSRLDAKSADTPICEMLDGLVREFHRLARDPVCDDNAVGAVARLEIVVNHLHAFALAAQDTRRRLLALEQRTKDTP